MSQSARIAVIVLAAGHSRRFGIRNKLLSPVHGKPLAAHIIHALQGLPYAFGAVVTRNPDVAGLFRAARFNIVVPQGIHNQSQSLKAGLKYAQNRGASHILLLLADMPGITHNHLRAVLSKTGTHPAISQYNQTFMPPALIPRALFSSLMLLQGDKGAAVVLRHRPDLICCIMPENHAIDIDTPDDISKL